MNWLAILCAAAAYFFLGFVWYSLLFGKIWAAEQARHCGGEGTAPAPREFAGMLIAQFVCNLVASAAIASLLRRMAIVRTADRAETWRRSRRGVLDHDPDDHSRLGKEVDQGLGDRRDLSPVRMHYRGGDPGLLEVEQKEELGSGPLAFFLHPSDFCCPGRARRPGRCHRSLRSSKRSLPLASERFWPAPVTLHSTFALRHSSFPHVPG